MELFLCGITQENEWLQEVHMNTTERKKKSFNRNINKEQTRSCQYNLQFINPQGFVIDLAQNLNQKYYFSQSSFKHFLQSFWSSVTHWLQPGTGHHLL